MFGVHIKVSNKNQRILKKILCIFLSLVLLGLTFPQGVFSQVNAFADNSEALNEEIQNQEAINDGVNGEAEEDAENGTDDTSAVENSDSENSFASFSEENNTTIHFITNTSDGKLPEGIGFYRRTLVNWESFAYPSEEVCEWDNNTIKVTDDKQGYNHVLWRYVDWGTAPYWDYGFKYENEDVKNKWTIVKWQYSYSEQGPFTDFGSSTIGLSTRDTWLKIIIEPAPQVSFSTNLDASPLPSGLKFFEKKNGSSYEQIDISKTFGVAKGAEFKYADTPEGYDGCFSVGSTIYCFKFDPGGDNSNYKYIKWTFKTEGQEESDVTVTGATINEDINFKAYFTVRVNFEPNDANKGSVYKSPSISNYDYYLPGTSLSVGDNLDEFIVGDSQTHDTYKAYPKDGNRFWRWSIDSGVVSAEPITIVATFSDLPIVYFNHNLENKYADSGITFYKKLDPGGYVQVDLPSVDFIDNGTKFKLVDAEAGYAGALQIGNSIYCFKFSSTNANTSYDFGKWTYQNPDGEETLITKETDAGIVDEINFRVYFRVRIDLRTNNPAMGDINGSDVLTAYHFPEDNISFDTENPNKITIGQTVYSANAKPGYEFKNWDKQAGAVGVDPLVITATFVVHPEIKLDIVGENLDGMVNIIDDATGQAYDITQPIPGVSIGTLYNVNENDKTKIIIDGKSYTANILNSHYVDFEFENYVWFIGEDHIKTNPSEVKEGESFTFSLRAKRIDNLTVSGSVKCGDDVLANSNVRADITVGDAKYSLFCDAVDGNYEFKNIPHDSTVEIYADCSKYTAGKISVNVDNVSVQNQIVYLEEGYSFIHGGIAEGNWSDTRGLKSASITGEASSPEGKDYYVFAVDSTLKLKANAGDKFFFANLMSDDFSTSQIVVGTQEKTWSRFDNSITLTANDIVDGYVTIKFVTITNIDFIGIKAADRIVTFNDVCSEGSSASGSFSATSISVPGLGASCHVDSSDQSLLVFSNGSSVSATPTDENSMLRRWNIEGTYNIVENEVITAKFVQTFVKINFDKGDSPVAVDSIDPQNPKIRIDSEFVKSQSSALLTGSDIVFIDSAGEQSISIEITNQANVLRYKFNKENPIVDPEYKKINEDNYQYLERDGLTITYQIEQRVPVDVYLALAGGSPVDGFFPNAVNPEQYGGAGDEGKWVYDSSNNYWKNSFYEMFPISGNPGILQWLPTDITCIDKHDGFFTGQWEGETSGVLDKNKNVWTAKYDKAFHVSGVTYDNKGNPLDGVKVKLSSKDGETPIAPNGVKEIVVTSSNGGNYDAKIYKDSNVFIEVGDASHIYQSTEISSISQDLIKNFTLDNGYSWLPKDFSNGTWDSCWDAGKIWTSNDATGSASAVTLDAGKTITYTFINGLNVGDKVKIFGTGASSVIINNGFDQTIDVIDGKVEYTVWNTTKNLTVTPVGASFSMNRIDYNLMGEPILTYAGKVTKNSQSENLEGVHIYFTNGQTVLKETTSDASGNYYLMLDSPATGFIYYEKDHFLDHKVELTNVVTSKYDQNVDMVECVYLTGKVYQEQPGTSEYVIAADVEVTFEPAAAYVCPVKTDSSGNYLLKVAKGSTGASWYYKDGWASFSLSFDNPLSQDINLMDVKLPIAGATVLISGDTNVGHNYFKIDYYDQGILYHTDELVTTEPLKFAEAGKFSCGYDENFNHVLEYDFPGQQFHITLTPIAKDGYSFWTWSYLDPDTQKKHVLYDKQDEIGPLQKGKTYKFFTDYTESNEITVGGKEGEGHKGWLVDLYINDNPEPEYHGILGPAESLNLKFPVSTKDLNIAEEIQSYYMFNGSAFELSLYSEFDSSTTPGEKVPYRERRVFTPIPEDGYKLDGIAVNEVNLQVNDKHEIIDNKALSVLAKFSLISVGPNVATGDSLGILIWIIGGIALLALASLIVVLNRRKIKKDKHHDKS